MKPVAEIIKYFERTGRIIDSGEDGIAGQLQYGRTQFKIIASWGGGWDHVSVSLFEKRCPTWEEMCFIKEILFKPNEAAYQLHPTQDNYVNSHKYCLHIWRPQNQEIPTPPTIFV